MWSNLIYSKSSNKWLILGFGQPVLITRPIVFMHFSKQKLNLAFSFSLNVQADIWWHTSKPWKLSFAGEIWASFYDHHCPFMMSREIINRKGRWTRDLHLKKNATKKNLPITSRHQDNSAMKSTMIYHTVDSECHKKCWNLMKHSSWILCQNLDYVFAEGEL